MPKFCAMNTKDGFLEKPYAPSMQLAIDNGLEESLRREDGSNTVSSQKIVQEAQAYKEKAGINKRAPDKYQQLDENFAKQVAKAYEEMRHNPSDPETANAYQALITETLAQYEEIIANGLQVEFIPDGSLSPYEIPSQAVEDIVTNNHMWVYSTRVGHGQGESLADNPLLQETQHKISGQTALANDIFRVVHDYYGHAKNGIGFRAEGEENAFLSHSAMYTNLAQRALATETRGQNSWVNFGPYGAQNKNASESDTIFAPQKVGLLPEELSNPSNPYESEADAISETVKDMKNGSAFGETFNIDGSRYTGGGIGVAVISVNVNTKNLTPAMIRGKIKKFLRENRLNEKIGVFNIPVNESPDDTDGKISSIDLTLIFPQEQKNLAIQLGSYTRQQSLWDFDNSELVYTGRNDTGLDHRNLTPTQLSAVRDAMDRGELPSFVSMSDEGLNQLQPTPKSEESTRELSLPEPDSLTKSQRTNLNWLQKEYLNPLKTMDSDVFMKFNAKLNEVGWVVVEVEILPGKHTDVSDYHKFLLGKEWMLFISPRGKIFAPVYPKYLEGKKKTYSGIHLGNIR